MEETTTASAPSLSTTYSAPRVALLTNFVPPYRVPVFKALQDRLGSLSILISTPMEDDRPWPPDFSDLDVTVQKSLTLHHRPRHPHGFRDDLSMHIPYDSLMRLQRLQPGVIITAELGMRTLQALLYRRLHSNTRLVLWATLSEVTEIGRGRLRRMLRQWILPRADAVIVNGRSGARYIEQFRVPREKIFIVPQTVEVGRFSRMPLNRDLGEERRFLYVGRLIELKGLIQFLSVLSDQVKMHPAQHFEFWVVGDGPMRSKLESWPVPDNLHVTFWGNVPYSELPGWYARAGILVLPTLADEWGLVVNEAMAAGLPILGSRYSQAVEELVEDGVTGWTFRPDRGDEMRAAIGSALSVTGKELDSMRVCARERIRTVTPESVADRIVEAITYTMKMPHEQGAYYVVNTR